MRYAIICLLLLCGCHDRTATSNNRSEIMDVLREDKIRSAMKEADFFTEERMKEWDVKTSSFEMNNREQERESVYKQIWNARFKHNIDLADIKLTIDEKSAFLK